jgi:hypothetical protein
MDMPVITTPNATHAFPNFDMMMHPFFQSNRSMVAARGGGGHNREVMIR